METKTSPLWPLLVALAAGLVYLNTLGNAPFGFHLVNLILHAGVAGLAWMTLRRAGTRYGTALLGGLLFAVHPIHTEAVAGAAGRAELLAALFVLAAWLLHGRVHDDPATPGARVGAASFYLAAILFKEGVVLAPLLFWADDALRGATRRRENPAVRYGGYVVALVAMLVLRAIAPGVHQGAAGFTALENPAAAAGALPRVLTALWVQLKYALLCVWPRPLSSDYSFDAIPVASSWGDPRALAGLAFLVAWVGAVVWGWSRSRPVALGALAWMVFFLPSANLLFPLGTVMAERLVYLPSLGFCLVAGHLGAAAAARFRPAPVVAAGALVVAAYGVGTWARNPAWKDSLTLATTDVVTYPRSAKLQAGAGISLAAVGRKTEAEPYLRRAIEIYPDYAQMHYNLAVLLAERGASDEAVDHLRRAIELAPANPRPRQLLEQMHR